MKVTDVRVFPVKNHSRLKATVTLVFDAVFKVRNIKVLPRKNNEGLYVSFPEVITSRGDYHAVAYPVSKDFRSEVENIIINEYRRILKSQEKSESVPEAEDFEEELEVPDEE